MPNTYTSLYYHVVFSTKDREPWIRHDIEDRIWNFIGGIARENGMKSLRIGGMPDHVHAVLALPPTLAISKAVQHLKGGSSKWIKETIAGMNGFSWQDGYSAFSVSKSNLDGVIKYVDNQREHHHAKTFQEVSGLSQSTRHRIRSPIYLSGLPSSLRDGSSNIGFFSEA